jgi:hypothetical protein
MMPCGIPVVDLDAVDSYKRHGSDYPAVLAQPDPQTLGEALGSLFTGGNDYAELSRRSQEFASRFPSREEALKQVAVIIEQEIGIESDS